jgi:hypothetical protein
MKEEEEEEEEEAAATVESLEEVDLRAAEL